MDPAATARHAALCHAHRKETTRSNQKQELPETGQTPKAPGIARGPARARLCDLFRCGHTGPYAIINLMKNLIIVGGTAGVGKTTTCRELRKILPRNVFLDGDWCWDMRPFVVTEETKAMVESNIAHLLNGFLACSELENVIFCWVIHEQSILDNLINSLNLNGCTSHCFSLVSTERALIERISRDIAAGKRDSDTTERSVARIPLYDKLNTVKIDVSTISPADAAQRIAEHVAGVQVPVTTAP